MPKLQLQTLSNSKTNNTLSAEETSLVIGGISSSHQQLINYFDDMFHGGSGNDIIHGGSGNDIAFGGSGNDIIYGGLGNDVLVGD